MTSTALPYCVAALYKFAPVTNAGSTALLWRSCVTSRRSGAILIAAEGLNGTIAGTDDAIEQVLVGIRAIPRFAELDVSSPAAHAVPPDEG
jgi:UPF0176 protein